MPSVPAHGQYELALNCDILLLLLTTLDERKAVLSFMRTCRFLYYAGTQKLLSFPVTLSYKRDFASFCDFILEKPLMRPQHLHELVIASAAHITTEHLLGRFVQVLKMFKNLEQFTMMCGDNLSEAAIVDALASLKSIKQLSIDSPNAKTMLALRRWHSPVERANVTLDEVTLGVDGDDFRETLLDPSWIFAAFRSSLRTMTTQWAQSFSSGPPFPLMRDLTVHSYYPAAMAEVARAFPDLATLSVSFEQGFDEDELRRERQRNALNQRNSQWQRLDYVGGDIGSVYVLGLPCQVRQLDLTVPRRCHNPDELLRALLPTAQPERLNMRFIVRSTSNMDHMMDSLRSASPFITHLEVSYHVPSDNTNVGAVLDGFVEAFTELSQLSDLKLSVEYFRSDRIVNVVEEDGVRTPPARLPPDAAERFLEQYDVTALAAQLVDVVPTLQKICLSVERNGNFEWEVVKDEMQARSLRTVHSWPHMCLD